MKLFETKLVLVDRRKEDMGVEETFEEPFTLDLDRVEGFCSDAEGVMVYMYSGERFCIRECYDCFRKAMMNFEEEKEGWFMLTEAERHCESSS
jgi:hypothetical protein